MRRIMITAVVFVALAGACSGGDDGPGVEVSDTFVEAPTTTVQELDADVRSLVEGIATSTAASLEEVRGLTAEGSDAQAYIDYQIVLARALKAIGQPNQTPDSVTVEDQALKTCSTYEGEEICYTWTDFAADPSGRITSFSVNDKPITGRVVRPSAPVEFDGSTYQVAGGLETSTDGTLLVAVTVKAGGTGVHFPYSASFVGGDGIQIQYLPQESGIPTADIAEGATAYGVFGFQQSALPGRFLLDNVCSRDYSTCESIPFELG
jgi:hypothetical protein